MINMIYVLLTIASLIILFKVFQHWCVWFVFCYQYKDVNSKFCKIGRALAPYMMDIGLFSILRFIKTGRLVPYEKEKKKE